MGSATSRRCIDPSATDTVSNASETAFAKTIPIPGYEWGKHLKFRCGGTVKHPATNSTDTARIRAYIGTAKDNTGILVADTTAVDLANDAVSAFTAEGEVKVNGAGSTAEIHGQGIASAKSGGTANPVTFGAVDAQFDTGAQMYLTVTCIHSSASGNSARLDSLWLETAPLEVVPAG